ncbi:30s ribosomal protein s17 [Chrysochromulina tobinii]|uniref:30s ribosomal protein s17 n=1 Tax=Chrysochromulina tobinii TaxID=1460289 RepID=A0A0M0J4B8_9EUKA|nr:30s ribosomal protein s17 [Chrysochromulina tobinii]|eukprot:KOO21335.1 30s ribosomal protein s17 [Chrysochromulina sp. CCMP291]
MPQHLPRIRYMLGELVGRVTSVANNKTAVVQVPRLFRDPKVGKDVRRRTKMWAHDEFNLCALGDIVRLEPSRALSKKKAHIVAEIIHKENGSTPPTPFPSR